MTPVFVLTLLVGAAAGRDVATSNPLGKVIELMDGLTAKITAEGEAEAKAFKDYFEWCDNAAANLHNEIKNGGNKQEELEATISSCKADIEANSVKIEELSGAIAADEKELTEVLSMLERATSILSKEMANSGASMLQMPQRGPS